MNPLNGIHHVTCITADALSNVAFYTGVLGLRMVGKSINQDDPTVYHLFYADEHGSPGSDITFFEYAGAARGRAGAGMVYRVVWRVASAESIAFWERRLGAAGVTTQREGDGLRFADPEGLEHALAIDASGDPPLVAMHPEIPVELALRGFAGVHVYAGRMDRTRGLLEGVMGARPAGERTLDVRGSRRGGTIALDPPPAERGIPGAGTVHHVAWGTTVAEHPHWVETLHDAGVHSTPVIDRHFFRSIYFREPGGVLFEIADDGPGFEHGVPADEVGVRLVLPPWFESQRAQIEAGLTPLPDPRAAWIR